LAHSAEIQPQYFWMLGTSCSSERLKPGSIPYQSHKKEAIFITASFLWLEKLIKVTDQSISRDADSSCHEAS